MIIDTQLASFFTAGALIIIGIFAALFLDNLIKKVIGLCIYRRWSKSLHNYNGLQSRWNCIYFPSRHGYGLVFSKCIISTSICLSTYQYCYRSKYSCCNACFNNRTLQKIWIHKSIKDSWRVRNVSDKKQRYSKSRLQVFENIRKVSSRW